MAWKVHLQNSEREGFWTWISVASRITLVLGYASWKHFGMYALTIAFLGQRGISLNWRLPKQYARSLSRRPSRKRTEQEKILLKELRLSFHLSLAQFYHDETILSSPNTSGYEQQQALRMCNMYQVVIWKHSIESNLVTSLLDRYHSAFNLVVASLIETAETSWNRGRNGLLL